MWGGLLLIDYWLYESLIYLIKWNRISSKLQLSIWLYGCPSWTLTKHMEKKLDRNYTKVLSAVLNISWKQHLTKKSSCIVTYFQLQKLSKLKNKTCGALMEKQGWSSMGPYTWMNQCWLISKSLHQLCVNTGCCLEDLLGAMDDRDGCKERVRKVHAVSVTWWWWRYLCLYIYTFFYLYIYI